MATIKQVRIDHLFFHETYAETPIATSARVLKGYSSSNKEFMELVDRVDKGETEGLTMKVKYPNIRQFSENKNFDRYRAMSKTDNKATVVDDITDVHN